MRYAFTILILIAATGCADKRPPTFEGDAALEIVTASARAISLRWPAAHDDRSVHVYRVFRDDEQVAELPASELSFQLRDLRSSTDYLVGVLPVDEAGNAGERLSLVASTTDGEPPTFAAGARLRIRDVTSDEAAAQGSTQLTLEWPTATDASGVRHYQLTREGETLATVDADQSSYTLESVAGENVEGAYGVIAEDAAGNLSEAIGARYPALELEAPALADATLTQPSVQTPIIPNLPAQPNLRLNPGLSRALRPENLRRIRLLGSPTLSRSLVPSPNAAAAPAP